MTDVSRSAAELGRLHTGTVADVLDAFGIWGVLDPALRCLNKTGAKVFGPALTVRWAPTRKPADIAAPQRSTWEQVEAFLVPGVTDATGKLYVAGCDSGLVTDQALAGGFSSGHFQRLGFAGLVLGGAIRDAHVVDRLDMPVWATGYTPADTQGSYQVLEVGTWCRIGNVVIHTGDWIIADETGIVAVPAAVADRVFGKSLETELVEAEIAQRVEGGEWLIDIVRDKRRL